MNNPHRKSRIANAASLVFLLYLLCSLKAAADDFFSKDYRVGEAPVAVAVGDFNGDHRLDIVIGSVDVLGSLTPVKASLLLGHGDGTFQSAVQLNIEQLTRSSGRRNDLQENAAPYYSD